MDSIWNLETSKGKYYGANHMEPHGLFPIAVGQRAKRACQAAEGTFYAKSIVQQAPMGPFQSEQVQFALSELQKK